MDLDHQENNKITEEEAIAKIKDMVKNTLKEQLPFSILLDDIIVRVKKALAEVLDNENIHLRAVVDSEDPFILRAKPANLYTFLCINGIFIPPSILEGKTEYECKLGTFKVESGECFFKPPLSFNYIKANITLDKSE